jgi:hypothetical protein
MTTIICKSCRCVLTAVLIAESGYSCPGCGNEICVMCGCTEDCSCLGGCSWIPGLLGVCNRHEDELTRACATVFGEPESRFVAVVGG